MQRGLSTSLCVRGEEMKTGAKDGIIKKRCANCRRLVPADALICMHCGGVAFVPVKQGKKEI